MVVVPLDAAIRCALSRIPEARAYLSDGWLELDNNICERRLGLDVGTLSNGDSVALYIPPQNLSGIRVPSGNEGGANTQWLPGGFTTGGTAEAVVDLRNAPLIEIEF